MRLLFDGSIFSHDEQQHYSLHSNIPRTQSSKMKLAPLNNHKYYLDPFSRCRLFLHWVYELLVQEEQLVQSSLVGGNLRMHCMWGMPRESGHLDGSSHNKLDIDRVRIASTMGCEAL